MTRKQVTRQVSNNLIRQVFIRAEKRLVNVNDIALELLFEDTVRRVFLAEQT